MDSLLKQSYKNFEIIFIDDCSTDGSFEYAKEKYGKYKNIVFIRNNVNKGYVYNINCAFNISRGKLFCNSNIDLMFDKDWLKELVNIIINDKSIGTLGSGGASYYPDKKKIWLKTFFNTGILFFTDDYRYDERKLPILSSGIFCIRKNFFINNKITPFDYDYFMYCEDDYLGFLTNFLGYKTYTNLKALFKTVEVSYTKKTNPKFRYTAEFHSLKNLFLNYFLFFDTKTLLKIIPYMLVFSLAYFFKKPKFFVSKIKSYLWLIFNTSLILKKRSRIQKLRKVSDEYILSNFYSYKLFDEKLVNSKLLKMACFILNSLSCFYCRLLNIKTFDLK